MLNLTHKSIDSRKPNMFLLKCTSIDEFVKLGHI